MQKVSKVQHTQIVAMFREGKTLHEVGHRFGISRERVRQILALYGLRRCDGGKHVAVKKAEDARIKARDQRYLQKYGCTYNQFTSVRGSYSQSAKAPLYAFIRQQQHAQARGVVWNLKFWDWWCIWLESGKWSERGKGRDGYCMCRLGDEGAYEPGNIYIGRTVMNSVEGRTLAFERSSEHTRLYRIMKAAGGRKAVSHELEINPEYMSQLANRGHIPKTWIYDGRAEALAAMTCGAYELRDLRALVSSIKVAEVAA